jgi:plastocyanin
MIKLLMQIALLCLPAAVQAAAYTVTASNSGFVPKNLTINSGDAVTFLNAGGQHNVHAISGPTLFRCANDCAADSDASNKAWSATITFPTAGTVNYVCDPHAGMGMIGSIVVKAVAAPAIKLDGYMSGNWYDPSQSGHGFELEFTSQPSDTPGQNTVVAYWYVYTPDGSGQNWLFAAGGYDATSNAVTLPALLLGGAKFPPLFDSGALTQTEWGTLTFSFTDCNNGTASWTSTVPGYGSGSVPIARLTSVAGTSCPAP